MTCRRARRREPHAAYVRCSLVLLSRDPGNCNAHTRKIGLSCDPSPRLSYTAMETGWGRMAPCALGSLPFPTRRWVRPEIGTSGSMNGDGKRGVGHWPQATAPIL